MGRGFLTAARGLLLTLLIAGAATGHATAVTPNGTGTSRRGGVTVSPAFQQISIRPDQDSLTYDFLVTNNADQEYEFAISVVDFGSLDETGGVLFVGNGDKALNYRYALTPWVTLQKDRVVVAPHATEKVPITIDNKESLTPGGHYGAVLVTPTDAAASGSKKVQIDQVASSLLFLKKVGGEAYRLNLGALSERPHFFGLPDGIGLRFQNAGNVHVTPHGLVTLTDPRGHVVKRGVINEDSGIVLPETFRSLRTMLQPIGSSWLPGTYKITASYRYDDDRATRRVSTSFIYFNLFPMLLLLVLLAAIAFAVSNHRLRGRLGRTLRPLAAELRRKAGSIAGRAGRPKS